MSITDNYGDTKIVLTEERDDFTAYSSPYAEGHTFVDGEQVSEETYDEQHGAPFPVDINFHGRHPIEGEIQELREELGEAFTEQFDSKVDEVYKRIEQADDPLAEIMSLEPAELRGE